MSKYERKPLNGGSKDQRSPEEYISQKQIQEKMKEIAKRLKILKNTRERSGIEVEIMNLWWEKRMLELHFWVIDIKDEIKTLKMKRGNEKTLSELEEKLKIVVEALKSMMH